VAGFFMRNYDGTMPTAREAQLQRLIRITDRQIAEIDARLLGALSEEDARRAIETAAELQVTRLDLQELLAAESPGA
jgi:hypothetical protein